MLLVRRDIVYLQRAEGEVKLPKMAPEKLKHPFLVAPTDSVRADSVSSLENEVAYGDLFGVWSGYRSVLILGSDKMYKLKGVAFDPLKIQTRDHGDYWDVLGAQFTQSAQFEQRMSHRFNKVLKDEGLESAVECLGYWHFPAKVKGKKLSASIMEVKGDTRLDELVYAQKVLMSKTFPNFKLEQQARYFEETAQLYFDIGFIVGRLKKLMDRSGQTWGASKIVTNANCGNIVLYDDGNNVKVNFVDFDASCGAEEFSKSEIRDLQKWEYGYLCQEIVNIANRQPLSMRPLRLKIEIEYQFGFEYYIGGRLMHGFIDGYQSKKRKYENSLPKERFRVIQQLDETPNLTYTYSKFKEGISVK